MQIQSSATIGDRTLVVWGTTASAQRQAAAPALYCQVIGPDGPIASPHRLSPDTSEPTGFVEVLGVGDRFLVLWNDRALTTGLFVDAAGQGDPSGPFVFDTVRTETIVLARAIPGDRHILVLNSRLRSAWIELDDAGVEIRRRTDRSPVVGTSSFPPDPGKRFALYSDGTGALLDTVDLMSDGIAVASKLARAPVLFLSYSEIWRIGDSTLDRYRSPADTTPDYSVPLPTGPESTVAWLPSRTTDGDILAVAISVRNVSYREWSAEFRIDATSWRLLQDGGFESDTAWTVFHRPVPNDNPRFAETWQARTPRIIVGCGLTTGIEIPVRVESGVNRCEQKIAYRVAIRPSLDADSLVLTTPPELCAQRQSNRPTRIAVDGRSVVVLDVSGRRDTVSVGTGSIDALTTFEDFLLVPTTTGIRGFAVSTHDSGTYVRFAADNLVSLRHHLDDTVTLEQFDEGDPDNDFALGPRTYNVEALSVALRRIGEVVLATRLRHRYDSYMAPCYYGYYWGRTEHELIVEHDGNGHQSSLLYRYASHLKNGADFMRVPIAFGYSPDDQAHYVFYPGQGDLGFVPYIARIRVLDDTVVVDSIPFPDSELRNVEHVVPYSSDAMFFGDRSGLVRYEAGEFTPYVHLARSLDDHRFVRLPDRQILRYGIDSGLVVLQVLDWGLDLRHELEIPTASAFAIDVDPITGAIAVGYRSGEHLVIREYGSDFRPLRDSGAIGPLPVNQQVRRLHLAYSADSIVAGWIGRDSTTGNDELFGGTVERDPGGTIGVRELRVNPPTPSKLDLSDHH